MPFKRFFFYFIKVVFFTLFFFNSSLFALPCQHSHFVINKFNNPSYFYLPFLRKLLEGKIVSYLSISLYLLPFTNAKTNDNDDYTYFHIDYDQCPAFSEKERVINFLNPNVKLLGSHTIKSKTTFEGSRMGGFSGVYYDAHKEELYAITDETGKFKGNTVPSPHQSLSIKPKFFRFKITLINDNGKLSFKLSPIETVFLFDDETRQVSDNTLDPEALSCQKEICLLCSEPPTDKASAKSIYTLNKDGVLQVLYNPPSYFTPNARKKIGFEKNSGFEACSFIPDEHDRIVAINEKPLLQDGFCKDPFLRFTIFSLENKDNTREGDAKCLASFPYRISPIESKLTQNLKKLTQGISDVLAMGDGIFLVVERSYITYEHNRESLSVSRVFKVDLHDDNLYASNLCARRRIFLCFYKQATTFLKYLKKEPFLNFMNFLNFNEGFESVSLNIEGLTKGPCYNGKATLITVNDNNFVPEVDTVFSIFLMIDSPC